MRLPTCLDYLLLRGLSEIEIRRNLGYMNAREVALKGLYEIDVNGAYLNIVLKNSIDDVDARDRGLFTELLYGVVENKIAIDYIISSYSKIRLKKISPWVLNILRMGIFQIYYMDKIPHNAICNEAVKLAKKYSHKAGCGFVNGLLRNFSREKENFAFPETENKEEELSLKFSYPLWFTKRIIKEYGAERCEELYKENARVHSPVLRVNTLKTDTSALVEILRGEGVDCEEIKKPINCVRVNGSLNVNKSKAYSEGCFSLQNISSQLAVDVLDPQEGETIIDMCAAPGGKSCAIAERMKNKGKIISFDIFEHKTELINKSAKRLGIDIIDAKVSDSTLLDKDLICSADRVLADVPCSGFGVIHKKPDIKYSRKEEDIDGIVEIQRKILNNSAEYVKPGGVLLYSTCTILPEENRLRIEEFLSEHKNYTKVFEKQILTSEMGESGFYICKMVKEK